MKGFAVGSAECQEVSQQHEEKAAFAHNSLLHRLLLLLMCAAVFSAVCVLKMSLAAFVAAVTDCDFAISIIPVPAALPAISTDKPGRGAKRTPSSNASTQAGAASTAAASNDKKIEQQQQQQQLVSVKAGGTTYGSATNAWRALAWPWHAAVLLYYTDKTHMPT